MEREPHYPRLPKTPFHLFPVPRKGGPSIDEIVQTLASEMTRPLLIHIARRPLTPPLDPRLDQVVIRLPKPLIPDGPSFSEFKMHVFHCIKQFPNAHIGITSSRSGQLALYIVARWLIEEKGIPRHETLALLESFQKPLTKQVYLNSLNELYSGFQASKPQPIPNYSVDMVPVSTTSQFPLSAIADDGLLKKQSSPLVEDTSNRSPVIGSIGMSVIGNQASALFDEVRLLLGMQESDPLIAPYQKFTRKTMKIIKEDENTLYSVMLEPVGYRCLLYCRGPYKYILGPNQFCREVKVHLPQHENKDHNLMSAIIEGILTVGPESKCKFWITDLYYVDSVDIRGRPFDHRMNMAHANIIHPRYSQIQRNLFTSCFADNDIDIDVRKFMRLKYAQHILQKPEEYGDCEMRGLLFVSREQPIRNVTKFYLWTGTFPDFVQVRVKVDREKRKVWGMARDEPDDVCVFDFGRSSRAWEAADGDIVDVTWSNESWVLAGISYEIQEMTRRECERAFADPRSLVYNRVELCEDVQQVLKLSVYVEEERQRSSARR